MSLEHSEISLRIFDLIRYCDITKLRATFIHKVLISEVE